MAAAIFAASRPTQSRLTLPRPSAPTWVSRMSTRRLAWSGVSSTALWRAISVFSASQTRSTTMISFSSAQMMLLSKDAPQTMSRAARAMSAVSSTTTGGLPAPAAIRRLSVCLRAASTTASPPVTVSRLMPG